GITVTSDPGTTNTTGGITGFQTFGDMMVGMSVTAFFTNGSSEVATWMATGPGAGRAQGTGWSLSESGDTFSPALGSDPWNLRNAIPGDIGITRLVLDGGPGMTIFDRTNPSPGTPGSGSGLDFTSDHFDALDITATYRNQVAVTPNAPVGDIYRVLDVQITSP